MQFFHRNLGVIAVLSLVLVPAAMAGPSIVRDSRVTDHATTPILGRGYSLATNTFQSACLKDVIITEPSYDFQYLFDSYEEGKTETAKISGSVAANASYYWIQGEASANATSATERGRTSHNVVVTLNMDTYYASVNESGTPLADAAKALLEREDIPGFFSACGPYYTRGINRNAQFVSLFTYETTTEKSDIEFEAQLKASLNGIGQASASTKDAFSRQASETSLTISTRGWGIGKNEDASLISYDIDTFKAAIKQAFISMQNLLTGMVATVEVIPWVENIEFQSTVNLRGQDLVDGKEVPLYEKKDILTFNAEFLAELNRAGRSRLDVYYKAKVCRDFVHLNWYRAGTLAEQYAGLLLRNHRLLNKDATVRELNEGVSDSNIELLWQGYVSFMYNGSPNATDCINKLMMDPTDRAAAVIGEALGGLAPVAGARGVGKGLYLRRFNAIPACADLQKQFNVQLSELVEDHCVPELN